MNTFYNETKYFVQADIFQKLKAFALYSLNLKILAWLSVVLPFVFCLATYGSSAHTAGTTGLLLGILLAGAAFITHALYINIFKSYCTQHEDLFRKKRQSHWVIPRVCAVADKIIDGGSHVYVSIAVTRLRKHFDAFQRNLITTPTPAGYMSNSDGRLPESNDDAFMVILREALHAVVEGENKDSGHNSSQLVLATLKLPTRTQNYIKSFFPELMLVNPLLFDENILDHIEIGLYSSVQRLSTVVNTREEVSNFARLWLTRRDDDKSTRSTDFISLPEDLM